MFSSGNTEWATPTKLYEHLDRVFKFDLDPAATHDNHKCEAYYTADDDGLSQDWVGRVYLNPPYGSGIIGPWIHKAYEESKRPACQFVVILLPARTDTAYWHDYIMTASDIWFIKRRLHFSGAERPAPFPSVVALLSGEDRQPQVHTLDEVFK
jgi:phage N-6-adenine-methyltransferase